ncbi:MAG: NAD(P)-dependent oxidoreductase [Phycisphaerae bacterium]|nr:NAD(P)-dependent oxidoreductase [Phycisphaerae bacterium]
MSEDVTGSQRPLRIVVTGSAGRLGRCLVEALAADGHNVRGYDREPAGEETFVGDLTNYPFVEKVCAGADVVCHLGAIPAYNGDDISMFGTNVRGTFNVFRAVARARVKKILFASSLAILLDAGIGEPPEPEYLPMDERHPGRCQDIYGVSKLFGEELGRAYSQQHGISVICLRPHCIIWKAQEDLTGPLGEGKVAVWDVIEAFRLALNSDIKYGVYNITGKDWSRITSAKAQRELGYEPRW